ncbi:MAG: DNA repair exonuclease [Desulfobacterales bacterium]|nr:DNA repair exonuclease [Desulfobacterales bacterium]
MFKFLHAADIHLDSPLQKLERYEGAPVEEIRRATRRALENLVALAIAEKVAFVLISGDLYDGDWRDYNTGLYFVSQMAKLREAGISTYIIAGNHDAANKMTRTLRLPDGVHLFSSDHAETVHLVDPDVVIHGQGFAAPAIRKDLSIGYPPAVSGYFNIGMLHTCATGREGHEPYAPCSINGLLSKGYDYWALGHVHQREVLHENPLIVFPGNIQGRHNRETGPKGAMLVTVDSKGGSQADFCSLDVIRWVHTQVDVSAAEIGYDVVDRASHQFEKLLEESQGLPIVVRVEIVGTSRAHAELAADPERWKNEIRSVAIDSSGGRIWVEKINLHTKRLIEGDMKKVEDGPVGELLKLLEEARSDSIRLKMLCEPLQDLLRKLPREIKNNADGMDLNEMQGLEDILDQVREMLLCRLMSKGNAE